MTRDRQKTRELVEVLAAALGKPVSTPEWAGPYRVHRWVCPACLSGMTDAGHQLGPITISYLPLVVDSDGRVWCEESGCTVLQIAEAVRRLRSTRVAA